MTSFLSSSPTPVGNGSVPSRAPTSHPLQGSKNEPVHSLSHVNGLHTHPCRWSLPEFSGPAANDLLPPRKCARLSLLLVGFAGTLSLPVNSGLSLPHLPPLPATHGAWSRLPLPLRWAAVATRGPGGKRQTSPLRGLCRGRRARSPSYVTASLFCKKRRARAWPSPCSRVRAAGRSIVLARDVGVGVADQRPPGAFPSRLHSPPQGLRY